MFLKVKSKTRISQSVFCVQSKNPFQRIFIMIKLGSSGEETFSQEVVFIHLFYNWKHQSNYWENKWALQNFCEYNSSVFVIRGAPKMWNHHFYFSKLCFFLNSLNWWSVSITFWHGFVFENHPPRENFHFEFENIFNLKNQTFMNRLFSFHTEC